MNRHSQGSSNHVLLAKWLGLEVDMMSMVGSDAMTSSDWMMLCALSNIGGQGSQKQRPEGLGVDLLGGILFLSGRLLEDFALHLP